MSKKGEDETLLSGDNLPLLIGEKSTRNSAVLRTVSALRADSLAVDPGTLIGSEEVLITRYGISRPTLRQAAGLVSQEELVRVRRGVGGGYFAERPTFSAVAHRAAVFLQTRDTGLEHILEAIEPIRVALVELAARNSSSPARKGLEAFVKEEEQRLQEPLSYRDFLRAERRFGELIGEASGNTVLHLYLDILLQLVSTIAPELDVFRGRPERVEEASKRRLKVAHAILDSDISIATIEARRSAQQSVIWMRETVAGNAVSTAQVRR
ncbi:hypothetical protein ACFB49_25990 [Sphingomonas sp. DBB INV C78]|uniref:FadR/GntR family transcriptional regulator n=1 Tax=Sphingomonas sp. DBB INV C78 TaxID=3349434 RepID=UPI0036D32E5D